jgi:pimeloyl-ACP methyl ester carboxylesterase
MPKVEVGGTSIYYEVQGKGEPLILIMGFANTHHAWFFQRNLSRYFKVITLDNRGVGKSGKPDNEYSIKLMARDVAGIMDCLKIEKAHIVGVSMGGMIAQEFALKYPHRILKLILGCTYGKFEKDLVNPDLHELEILLKFGCTRGGMRQLKKTLRKLFILSFQNKLVKTSVWILSFIYLLILLREEEIKGLIGQLNAIVKHDAIDRLHQINAKTLIIVGDKDEVIKPRASALIYERMPQAAMCVIEKGSHSFAFENWRQFNRKILEFLKEE